MNKKNLSKGFLGLAVGSFQGAMLAYIADTNDPSSQFMYIAMGLLLISIFLHWFFRGKDFDKKEIMKTIVNPNLLFLPVVSFFALLNELYIIMFIFLGLSAVTYLIHLLLGILKTDNEVIN